jgi:hypothetical protein
MDVVRLGLWGLIAGSCFALWSADVAAQSGAESNVLLEIEIVTPRQGANLLAAQRWGAFFRDQGEVVRVREPLPSDRVSATETPRGTFRLVKIVGVMDREGQLQVPGHQFRLDQPQPIQQWLKDLKTYGAQGNPEGQPLWGFTGAQFKEIYTALSQPVTTSIAEQPLGTALKQLPLPQQYPWKIHHTLTDRFPQLEAELVQDDVEGLSVGTAFSAVLVQFGLGFRPRRTPSGGVELVIQELSTIPDPWPVGWNVERTERQAIAPQLFKTIAAGFDNQPLEDVLLAISHQQEIPIIVERALCVEKEIDLARPVSVPFKSVTMWLAVLDSSVRQSRLEYFIRRDEAGKPLVFVTPFNPKRAQPPQLPATR